MSALDDDRRELAELRSRNRTCEEQIKNLHSDRAALAKEVSGKAAQVRRLEEEIAQLRGKVKARDQRLDELAASHASQIDLANKKIKDQRALLAAKEEANKAAVSIYKQRMSEKESEIRRLRDRLSAQRKEIRRLHKSATPEKLLRDAAEHWPPGLILSVQVHRNS